MVPFEVMAFWQKYHGSDDVLFSGHPVIGYMMLICFITGDVNFDHMAEVDLPSFSTVKLLLGKENVLNHISWDLIGFLHVEPNYVFFLTMGCLYINSVFIY